MEVKHRQSLKPQKLMDSHMLIGTDRSGKTGNIADYMKKTNGIYDVVGAMSTVCPGYKTEKGIYFPSVWETAANGIISRSVLQKSDGTKIYGETPENPYEIPNKLTREELIEASLKYPGTQFLQYPLLHLTRDTPEYLEKVLESNRIVKVHGIASALGPEDISEEIGMLMKKYDNIVLPHTDYFQSNPGNALQYLQKRNDPSKWMDFFEKYSIKGMFAHGARLCGDTLEKISKNADQFIVEAGPIINTQGARTKTHTSDYVGKLIDMVGTDSIIFNTDYPFMKEEEDLEKDLRLRLSDEDYKKVMYENAKRFLKLDDSKYLRGNEMK